MFIYAVARELARADGRSYCLGKIGKLEYFELSGKDRFNLVKLLAFKAQEKILRNVPRFRYIDQWITYYDKLHQLPETAVVDGYFQSPHYFTGSEDLIRRSFRVKEQYRKKFEKFYAAEMQQPTVVVHVRRTDYSYSFQNLGLGEGSFVLPLDYYENAFSRIPDLQRYTIIFLSDDIPFVKQHFPHFPKARYSSFDEITDLQIMTKADILIMANSSFSWWGAWLNDKPHKRILVPEYYLGFKVKREFPVDIIPPGWEKVSFTTP